MMTQSHLLITALVADRARRAGVRVRTWAALLGSVAPDLPLALLTGWFVVWRRQPGAEWFGTPYDDYFFGDPLWVVSHNILHAPLILAVVFLTGQWLSSRGQALGAATRWFAAGAAAHTLIDVFTHRHDGPLLLFPLDWSFRVQAPVSYWDPRYGGAVFFRFEIALDLLIAAYFLVVFARRVRRAGVRAGACES